MSKPKKPSSPGKRSYLDWVPRKDSDVLSRCTANGAQVVIYRLDNYKVFFTLEKAAARFWGLIDGKKTVQQICSIITLKDSQIRNFKSEVKRLLSDLTKHRLIECGGKDE